MRLCAQQLHSPHPPATMIRRLWLPLLCLSLPRPAAATSEEMLDHRDTTVPSSLLRTVPPSRRPSDPSRPPECPPCFNCLLPAFNCGNSGECNPYDGQCKCPPGFGGQDCLTPRMSPRCLSRAMAESVYSLWCAV